MSTYTIETLINATNSLAQPGQIGQNANQNLMQFTEDENAWQLAPDIISSDATPDQLKTYAVTSLKNLIRKRWGLVDEAQRGTISGFLFNFIIDYAGKPKIYQPLLDEADLTLVYVLIQEWPHNHTSFFNDIINAAGNSEAFCCNSLKLIELFCQLVLEDNETEIPYAKSVELANNLQNISQTIYNFLGGVITSGSENTKMISSALSSLKYFFRWLDPREIVSNQIFQSLCTDFLPNQAYVTPVLELFYDLFSSDLPNEIKPIVPQIFHLMITSLNALFSGNPDFDFNQLLQNDQSFSRFVRILPMALSAFIQKYADLLEIPDNVQQIHLSLNWICNLMLIDDEDILTTCSEFWLYISRRCHRSKTVSSGNQDEFLILSNIYAPLFSVVRRRLIQRMQEPEEHIKNYDDEKGIRVRERRRNTASVILHSVMKECLAILTTIDPDDTLNAIRGALDELRNWDPDAYNRLCWSVGAITRTLSVDAEKTFISNFIRMQLDMCNQFSDPEDRATVARGIMYVCSQYPRFLSHFPQFLVTVTKKLFEFMHQDVRDLKEMAVMSFKTIAEKCSRIFITPFQGADQLYIEQIIATYPEIIIALPPDLKIVFFDALSVIINSNTRDDPKREQLMLLLAPLNAEWDELMNSFTPDNPEIAQLIAIKLFCNSSIASNVKTIYFDQFMALFPQMMDIYDKYSMYQNSIASDQMPPAAIEANRSFIMAKSSIIGLIRAFITKTTEVSNCRPCLPPIIQVIITNYGNSHPYTRTPEVLDLISDLFMKMRDDVSDQLPSILGGIFMSTFQMIETTGDIINDPDFSSFVNFRLPFFNLLRILVVNFFEQIITLDEGFQLIMQAIRFGYFHPVPDCCEKTLDTVMQLLKKIKNMAMSNQQIVTVFSENYYLPLVEDMFRILTDTLHKFAFDKNIELLAYLLQMQVTELNPQNVALSIIPLFQDKDQQQIYEFVCALIAKSNNTRDFKQLIKDFLVFTRTFKLRDPDLDRENLDHMNQENQQYLEQQVLDNNDGADGGFEFV